MPASAVTGDFGARGDFRYFSLVFRLPAFASSVGRSERPLVRCAGNRAGPGLDPAPGAAPPATPAGPLCLGPSPGPQALLQQVSHRSEAAGLAVLGGLLSSSFLFECGPLDVC